MKERLTRQLAAVHDVVSAARDHPTAEDVWVRVRRRLPRVSLGTVYRNLQRLVEDYVLTGGRRCFFIADQDRLRGLLSLSDVAKIPRDNWVAVAVGDVMVPWERLIRVETTTPLLRALQIMDDANVSQVPVVSAGRLVGMLSREHVLRYIRTRAELGI